MSDDDRHLPHRDARALSIAEVLSLALGPSAPAPPHALLNPDDVVVWIGEFDFRLSIPPTVRVALRFETVLRLVARDGPSRSAADGTLLWSSDDPTSWRGPLPPGARSHFIGDVDAALRSHTWRDD